MAADARNGRTAFDKARKEQDADFEAKGLRKSGVRVKVTLKSASEICVALADATIAKAAEFSASVQVRELARDQVLQFTKEIVSTAIPLAHFVGGDSPSVINAATERGQTLFSDVTGAFKLAEDHQLRSDGLASAAPVAMADGNAELPVWLNMYARQANIANGPQQVNNGLGTSPASNQTSPPNELLETEHGKRLEPGTASAAIGSDPALEAVGAIDGSADGGRQGTRQPQRRQGRKAPGAQG